jgi:predicted Zn-dependent protease with MMP-like domain
MPSLLQHSAQHDWLGKLIALMVLLHDIGEKFGVQSSAPLVALDDCRRLLETFVR